MFVLICNYGSKKGLMVAVSGRKSSYTNSIFYTKKYATREEAEADSCIESEYAREI